MEVITGMAIVALGMKVGVAVLSVLGVSSGINWFNKKNVNLNFGSKKKGVMNDDDSEHESETFKRPRFR